MENNKQMELYSPGCMENKNQIKLYSSVCMENNKQKSCIPLGVWIIIKKMKMYSLGL
jgi:hypothetical protein